MDMREWTEAQLDEYARQLDEQVHEVYQRKLELQRERDRRAALEALERSGGGLGQLVKIVRELRPAPIQSDEKFGKT